MKYDAPMPRPPEDLICILTKNHNKAGLARFLMGNIEHQQYLISCLSLDGQPARLPIEYAFDSLKQQESSEHLFGFAGVLYVAHDAIEYFARKTLDTLKAFSHDPSQFELVSKALSRLSQINHPYFEPYQNELLAIKVVYEQQKAMTFAYDDFDNKEQDASSSSLVAVPQVNGQGASSSNDASPGSSPRTQF